MMQGARKQQVACEATNASGATSHYFENIIFHPRDRARRGDASRTITAVFFPAVASRTTAGKRGYRRGQQVAHPGGAVQAPVYNRLGRNNAPLRARCRLRGGVIAPASHPPSAWHESGENRSYLRSARLSAWISRPVSQRLHRFLADGWGEKSLRISSLT